MQASEDHQDVEIKYPADSPVFFIGTSGKGVQALQYLAEAIPSNFPSPFFFLLHRVRASEAQKHYLPDILAHKSNLTVTVPQTGDTVSPGTIYLPPIDQHLTVQNNKIVLTKEPSDGVWRPSIDVLFKSGAQEYRDRAVSVLLTGRLEDGVEGLRETTFQGGITVAQSPDDAYDPHLPLNAILKDHPQYVLPLRDMPTLLCELAGYGCEHNQESILRKAAMAAARKKQEVRNQRG